MSSGTYPSFQGCGDYDGSTPVVRWFKRLDAEFRPYNKVPATELSAMFFDAISRLFVGKAMDWLETKPLYVKFVDLEQEPTASDVEEFRTSAMRKFPRPVARVEEGNIQEEIQNLKQGETEALGAYHERAQELLRRSHGRD
ncbi:hypothetical protein K3495_g1060 [Podosphaera aphanis]|nr:hypothetical protein K3495_g1060 [Podosphaera aphanis]